MNRSTKDDWLRALADVQPTDTRRIVVPGCGHRAGKRSGMTHRSPTVRRCIEAARNDELRYGIGFYQPDPATLETEPDLEIWALRDRGRS